MDKDALVTVYANLQILEQQRQTQLLLKQKKNEQYMQENKLFKLKSQVGGLCDNLWYYKYQLSLRHRELLEMQ